MFGSFKIATIRGIPIRLNVTLVVVAALLMARFGVAFAIPAAILWFGSILLHELGHSLVAQRYGIRIAGIDLHVLGGMAMMTEQPRTPRQEIMIAAAGPLVSFALGALLFPIYLLLGAQHPFLGEVGLGQLVAWAMMLNFGMGIFNLIPALPMDGGRIFRAVLALRMGTLRATRIAANVSRVFAVLFVGVGLYTGAWGAAMIGVLLWMMVGHEERAVRMAEARANEIRHELIDPWGRRFVIITRQY